MATFGIKSKERLATCHTDIQKVMNEAIKHYDFTVLYGTRTAQEQFNLYKVGRKFVAGKWVIVGKTVTNLDGTIKKSNHNYTPSKAIDIAPYPIDWDNLDRFKKLSEVVLKAAEAVGVKLVWGGNWKMRDYPHYEIAE